MLKKPIKRKCPWGNDGNCGKWDDCLVCPHFKNPKTARIKNGSSFNWIRIIYTLLGIAHGNSTVSGSAANKIGVK